jgi:hypothetical protein
LRYARHHPVWRDRNKKAERLDDAQNVNRLAIAIAQVDGKPGFRCSWGWNWVIGLPQCDGASFLGHSCRP